jgi:uncharacterized membrane protein
MPHLGGSATGCIKPLLLLTVLLLPSIAKADLIECQFTEPFKTTSYNTSLRTMTVVDSVTKRRQIFDQISMREIKSRVFEFRNVQGRLLQTANRNCGGSDGMSDRVYPYDAQLLLDRRKPYGGCTSSRLKKC